MKKTILVVDDEVGPRESLRRILEAFYHIEVAENGRRALEILENKQVDLITLDLKMPDLSGEDLLKIIKRRNPQIEVIIVSGNGTLKSAVDGIRYRVADFITKPFHVTDLLNTVKEALERRGQRDALKEFLNEIGDTFGMDLPLPELIQRMKQQKKNG